MRSLVGIVTVTLPLVLACGGVSVDPADHLEPLCALPPLGPLPELATVSGVDADAVEGLLVRVTSEGFYVDWQGPGDGAFLLTQLGDAVELRELMGTAGGSGLNVAAEPGVSADQVELALRIANEAGFTAATLLFTNGESLDLPEPLDPAFADELRSELDGMPAESRPMHLAAVIESEIALCPGAQEAFSAVAVAPSDMKCTLIAHGMQEALPSCPLTDGDRVLTLMNVVSRPSYDTKVVGVTVKLDEDADGLPDGPWKDVAAGAASWEGRGVGFE